MVVYVIYTCKVSRLSSPGFTGTWGTLSQVMLYCITYRQKFNLFDKCILSKDKDMQFVLCCKSAWVKYWIPFKLNIKWMCDILCIYPYWLIRCCNAAFDGQTLSVVSVNHNNTKWPNTVKIFLETCC